LALRFRHDGLQHGLELEARAMSKPDFSSEKSPAHVIDNTLAAEKDRELLLVAC
jgi:hypothetical protein